MANTSSSIPPRAKSSSSDLYRELRKADRELMEALVKPIRDIAVEAKKIAIDAKSKAEAQPPCVQESAIRSIWKSINTGKTLKIGSVVAILTLVVVAVGNYFAFKDSIDDTQEDLGEFKVEMVSVKEDIASVKEDVQKVKSIVEDDQRHEAKRGKEQIEEIKFALQEVIEAQSKMKKKTKRKKK